MQCVDAREAPKPLIVQTTTFQEIQIIELHNTCRILIHGAPSLNLKHSMIIHAHL